MPRAVNGMKECSKCHEVKPVGEFGVWASGADGLRLYCKKCNNAMSREFDIGNPGIQREYRKKNRDRIRELDRKWRKQNPEKVKMSRKKRDKKSVKGLKDSYIKKAMTVTIRKKGIYVPFPLIPQELIEVQRTILTIKRELRSVK